MIIKYLKKVIYVQLNSKFSLTLLMLSCLIHSSCIKQLNLYQEEYYEYNHYRTHGKINGPTFIDDQTLQLTLDLPSADYKDYIMLNIDYRKHLAEHAENFVKRYEINPTDKSANTDAVYFVSMLKESDKKNELLKRIN